MRSLSQVTLVSLTCLFSAIGTAARGDLASGAPSGARLALTGISPTAGPLGGGNEVTIRADDAAAVTSVDFGAASGGRITHINAHLLRVIAPAHDAGPVDVVLHSASATSPVSPPGRYRFVPTPAPLQLQWSQRLGSPLGVGLLDAIGCTVHDFCAVEMRNRIGQVTALATFGDAHQPRVQALPDKPVISHTRCYLRTDCYQTLSSLIACGTPRFCVVGNRRYMRIWDGGRWGDPKQVNRRGDALLSCAPGTTLCVLGGRDNTFVHSRHGWRNVRYPHGFDHPTSLACATAHFCLAVAGARTAQFDGTSWHAAAGRPHLPAMIGCASAHYCLAIGTARAAAFDGATWRAVAAPPLNTEVRAVSCRAVGRCVAATKTSAETFVHGRWSKSQEVSPTRSLATAALTLNGLACVPHGVCRAIDGRGQTLRLAHGHWAGAENITAYHDRLSDISCASPTWCMAVGRSGETFRYSSGQWSREGNVDSRHPLVAISCTTDQVCVAVDAATGTKQTGFLSGGRAVRYSNGSWHQPIVIDTGHQLTDVSCASAEHCVAVDIDGRAITYRYGMWSDPTSIGQRPKKGLRFTWAVDCPTVHYCATAGYPGSFELVDLTWRRIDSGQPPVPQLGAPLDDTHGVDCVDARYCVFTDTFGVVIRNDGVVGTGYNGCCDGARPVSCASRTFCAAVYLDETDEDYNTHTYLINGGSVRRERKLSVEGRTPRGIACFAGPVCVGVTDTHGFVGT